ncbi:MAG: ATP-binding protein [Aquisalimonadaceae bacterium]
MMPSLQRRLLILATLILAGFLGATGLVLDQAFRGSLERAQQDRLQGYLYTLLAAATLHDGRLEMPDELPELRFHTIGSGLYARILDDAYRLNWQSDSLTGIPYNIDRLLAPGERRYYQTDAGDDNLYALAYGLSWEDADGAVGNFTLHIAESMDIRAHQLIAYRTSLWGWLAAAGIALLITQAAMLHWSLGPLRRVANDLKAMESGRKSLLDGHYPREIQGLINGLNQLIRNERDRTTRYRNSLADLAHSLKTPLTILRTTLEADPDHKPPPQALEQIERIHGTVDYQLGRAAAVGRSRFGQRTPILPVAERIMRSIPAVRPHGPPITSLHCAVDLRFPGPEGDLMELLGNLVDNACKWCRGEMALRIEIIAHQGENGLCITVDDDGPGVPVTQRERILQRGGRADESRPGHGIGLAVVRDLVDSYRGAIAVGDSPLGGARFRILIPNG